MRTDHLHLFEWSRTFIYARYKILFMYLHLFVSVVTTTSESPLQALSVPSTTTTTTSRTTQRSTWCATTSDSDGMGWIKWAVGMLIGFLSNWEFESDDDERWAVTTSDGRWWRTSRNDGPGDDEQWGTRLVIFLLSIFTDMSILGLLDCHRLSLAGSISLSVPSLRSYRYHRVSYFGQYLQVCEFILLHNLIYVSVIWI
jgi:hypothetical protein